MSTSILPPLPTFSSEDFERWTRMGDYSPALFELYKHTAIVTTLLAFVDTSSTALRPVPPNQFGTLVGLLHRCARLMGSNMYLSHEGKYGETTSIIDRCIFESAIKVSWLCKKSSEEAFKRFFAEGFGAELALKNEIEKNIQTRGHTQVIEQRMLKSIHKYFDTAKLTEADIKNLRLPNLNTMIDDLDKSKLSYVIGQKIGSHHVHGNWSSLLKHYLDWDNPGGPFRPKDKYQSTSSIQYVYIAFTVIDALIQYCEFIIEDADVLEGLVGELHGLHDEIVRINKLMDESDFAPI